MAWRRTIQMLLTGCAPSPGVPNPDVVSASAHASSRLTSNPGFVPGRVRGWVLLLATLLLAGCGTLETSGPDGGSIPNDGTNRPDEPPGRAWGWISVLEESEIFDAGWSMVTDWVGGVRAYFAESQSYPRALSHHLGFLERADTEGNCQLFMRAGLDELLERIRKDLDDCFPNYDIAFECWRQCGQDQHCVRDGVEGSEGICENLPSHFNPGKITIGGLSQAVTMLPDSLDRYLAADLPAELFDKGGDITASAEGGQLGAFTLKAKGVGHLEPTSGTLFMLDLREGNPATISWKTADPDSRVQLFLGAGAHDPNPLMAALLCDAPDTDGKIDIPVRLVDKFIPCGCMIEKVHRITRYTRGVTHQNDMEVELFVGSSRGVGLTIAEPW